MEETEAREEKGLVQGHVLIQRQSWAHKLALPFCLFLLLPHVASKAGTRDPLNIPFIPQNLWTQHALGLAGLHEEGVRMGQAQNFPQGLCYPEMTTHRLINPGSRPTVE